MKPTNHPSRRFCAQASLLSFGAFLAATIAHAAPAAASKTAAVPAPIAASATAPAAANILPTAESLRPVLPLEFEKFAPNFTATAITPPWLTVQVGTLETYFSPPVDGTKTSFSIDDSVWAKRDDFIASFHPIEISCLMGAKARYDNVTMLNLDKAGNPLGYTLPLGQILYFVASGESAQNVFYSVHYYDSGKDLLWVPNPEKDGAFIPSTPQSIKVTQDLGAPMESYTLLLLSKRVGEPRPDSTAHPLTLYTYLVIHIHRSSLPAAATGMILGR